MKSMIEHMATTVIMVLFLLVFSSVLLAEMQITNARKVHSAALDKIETSYFTVDVTQMNDILHEQYSQKDAAGNYYWNISVKDDTTLQTRQSYVVSLDYVVIVPVFNLKKTGTIEGYAR